MDKEKIRIMFITMLTLSLIVASAISLNKETQNKLDFCQQFGYNKVKINNKNTDVRCSNGNISYYFTQSAYKQWKNTHLN